MQSMVAVARAGQGESLGESTVKELTLQDLLQMTMTGEERFCLASEVDQVLKRQVAAALSGMNAATAISSGQLQQAARLRGESAPEALESQRAVNAILTAENERLGTEVRQAIADYMRSEGCSCCRDSGAHEKHTARLAELLDVPKYEDGSGYDFSRFRSPRTSGNGERHGG